LPSDVTVLVPVLRERKNELWLKECLQGFPPGTKYLVAENDGELAAAMNEALEAVETEWVMPFGHDDVPGEGLVEQLLAAGHDADVVYPTMILTDEELKPTGAFNADIFCGNRLLTWNYVTGAFLARTEMVRKVGGWRDLENLEDWDLHVRMFKAGARFKACPAARMYYRQSRVPGTGR
jgi:GT2 family glycosyltransferase